MTESEIRNVVRQELIREREIGSVRGEVTVRVKIDLTKHADERRFRHGNKAEITEDEIRTLVGSASDIILRYTVLDRLDVGETVVIKDRDRDLNVVAELDKGPSPSVLELTVITVMRKRDFKAKSRDTVIHV